MLTAMGATLAFGCIFAVGYYATRASLPEPWRAGYYVDATVMRFYFGSVVVIGALPVLLRLYRLGLIYMAGAAAGWVVNCILIATIEPPRPTMEPAIYNVLIVFLGALTAITVEVVHQTRHRRKRRMDAPEPSSR